MGVTGWGKLGFIAKETRFSQMLMEQGKSVSIEALADSEVTIKSLLKAK